MIFYGKILHVIYLHARPNMHGHTRPNCYIYFYSQ